MSFSQRFFRLSLSLALVSLPTLASAASETIPSIRFRVTVQNVTAANRISPFFATVLKPGATLFSPGMPASPGVQAVAETGSTMLIEQEATKLPGFIARAKATGGPLAPGATASVEFMVSESAVARGATLNTLAMIGMSNDSFVAIRALPLASIGQMPVILSATNYDSGTEENTGNLADFGHGAHPTLGAEGLVSADRGLNPKGDAPEMIGWGSTAALFRIERLY